MSILIKGMEMEMPRNCWECEFNKSTLDRMDFCTLTNKQYNWGLSERPSDCPLIEVPEDVQPVKHGRWIKARGSWCTPGGDPVWECSECGKGMHVYGIEHGTYGSDVADGQWVACPNCGARMEDGK